MAACEYPLLGFGLIGGSIARALHERGAEPGQWHVTAWSRTPAPVEQAVADGVVDVAAADSRGGRPGRGYRRSWRRRL